MNEDAVVDDPREPESDDSPSWRGEGPGPAARLDWAAFNRIVDGAHEEARAVAALRGVPLLPDAELKSIVDRHVRRVSDGAMLGGPAPPIQAAATDQQVAASDQQGEDAPQQQLVTETVREPRHAEGVVNRFPEADEPVSRQPSPFDKDGTREAGARGGLIRADFRSPNPSDSSDGAEPLRVGRAAWSGDPPPPPPLPLNVSPRPSRPAPIRPLNLAPQADPAPRPGSVLDRLFGAILKKRQTAADPYASLDSSGVAGQSRSLDARRLLDPTWTKPKADGDVSSRIPFRNDPDAELQPTSTDPAVMDQRDVAITTYKIARQLGASKAKALWLVATANKEAGLRLNAQNASHFGLFQFDTNIWKQLGGGADIYDQNAQIRAMMKRYDQIEEGLRKKNLAITDQNIYVVHQKGDTGGANLLGAKADLGAVAAIKGNKASQAGSYASVRDNLPTSLRDAASTITAGQLRDQLGQSWADKRDEAMQIMRSPGPKRSRRSTSGPQAASVQRAGAGQVKV